MKLQRTGLTEGSLIFNEWLKSKSLYREDAEAEFINWLYSTSGFYDSEIKGSYFDIDVEKAKKSPIYQRFLHEFHDSLLNSDVIHMMVHGSYHLNGQDKIGDFSSRFAPCDYCYWKDVLHLQSLIKDQRVLVVSSIAPLISDKYGVGGYITPQTHLNQGPDKNFFETLEKVIGEMPMDFDFALVSFGAYGCFMVDEIVKRGKSAATIGSGIYDLFPVGEIPMEYRPKGYEKIEGGRYWLPK